MWPKAGRSRQTVQAAAEHGIGGVSAEHIADSKTILGWLLQGLPSVLHSLYRESSKLGLKGPRGAAVQSGASSSGEVVFEARLRSCAEGCTAHLPVRQDLI